MNGFLSTPLTCLAAAVILTSWVGCDQPGDAHISALKEAERRVDAGMNILEQWHMDSVSACRERVAMRFKDLIGWWRTRP